MDTSNFEVSLGCLVVPALDNLAARLDETADLSADERGIVLQASHGATIATLHARLSRLLLLELNAARVTGRLSRGDGAGRWNEFLELSSQRSYWESLTEHYPTLLLRVDKIIQNRCASALHFAQRFAADRHALGKLVNGPLGDLQSLSFGAGDSHRCGQTVALVHCEGGGIVYKPRSVMVDIELERFVCDILADRPEALRIRVPRAIARDEYGYAELIAHRHADGPEELCCFYRGIGHWLAIMRLLGGSDLHAENLIAHGPCPVVVDCETLFTPLLKSPPSGLGLAADRANELLAGTVLNAGLLPGRGLALGWRGVDSSAVGSLPGQQPMRPQPDIVGAGSDQAYFGSALMEAALAQNHPSASPALANNWPEVLSGFTEVTDILRELDADNRLLPLLHRFADCRIRVVPRSTEVYAEVARMLWHPVSLHQQADAEQRARDLLAGMAENVPIAPDDITVIDAEIADLLEGDVPFFTALAKEGRLQGPRGTCWLQPTDLVADALHNWRNADFRLEHRVIQASLVSAYINDGWIPPDASLRPEHVDASDLDGRRRRQAKRIMESVISTRISGEDGSVAWIAPVLNPTGWAVQPLIRDLYNGASGIALLTAAYLREVSAGRADAIDGLDGLLPALLKTLHLAQAQHDAQRLKSKQMRPPPVGGYIGLGSQIWTWLILARWGIADDGIECAARLANLIPEAAAADEFHDLLTGKAGAIVPLLMLAQDSGQCAYLDMAVQVGDRLCAIARHEDGLARWPHPNWPQGVGGFAHGATGIGWALAKLAEATNEVRFADMSAMAQAFEDSLFNEQLQGWLDLRVPDSLETQAARCHGTVGIGLALADLYPTLQDERMRSRLRAAAESTWQLGIGWNHTLCHGDMGAWEFLQLAIQAGLGPSGLASDDVLAHILTSLDERGAVCGWARDTFSPSLMSGVGGVAYQLLRAHPESQLPSALILGGEKS